jgi:quinoprotein glucose dehydrogenase
MWRPDEGIRWQKAPRQFAGRGLAYWNEGADERVIVVTPGYHLASLDAKTGIPDPKFGKNGIVDLMDGLGLPLVPLAVDDSGSLIISDAAPYRQAKPGETWDPVKKIGADGTVGIIGQIAASSPAIVVNNVIVVGNSSIHGYYPIRVREPPGLLSADSTVRHRASSSGSSISFRSRASSAPRRGRTVRRSAPRRRARTTHGPRMPRILNSAWSKSRSVCR